jgi:hypothetical protein
VLSSGFHERLRDWWPGLDESGVAPRADGGGRATLITPPDAPPEEPWWTLRDREEELVMLARRLKADRRNGEAVPLDRTAIVFKHPLPYLYLAAEVFGAAGIPYRASDALPLAAEPTAAAIDLVLDAVASNFTRGTLVALLRSPHFAFLHDEAEITRESVSALDRATLNGWRRWRRRLAVRRPPRCSRPSRRRASWRHWWPRTRRRSR